MGKRKCPTCGKPYQNRFKFCVDCPPTDVYETNETELQKNASEYLKEEEREV